MATLVLTTVGTALGGPIGGAIGALLGNQIDRRVLAPKGRSGPRLGDLSVQTSSYGSAIPKLFGTMRVAGTVIWATDLREDTHRSGGGKAGGATTSYSYSASFAVALSARPIVGVRRIWADGKLLRGAAGDWKSETGFRLYRGGEGQAIDPLIASAEGIDATPAHRGIAYALFEAMQLADYGNRIPSLTFEVIADASPVPVARIAGELSGGAIAGEGVAAVGGYAASGDSVRGAIETLAAAYPLPLADDGTHLRIASAESVTIAADELGGSADASRQPRLEAERGAAGALPDAVAIAYYEPSRDYQAGLQRARRDGIARRTERIDLPAALTADDAKALAEAALARAWARRTSAMVRVPWRRAGVRAGTQVTLPDGGVWRVAHYALKHMAIALTLVRESAARPSAAPAAPGRATAGDDSPAGSSVVVIVDLPAPDDGEAIAPRLAAAVAGTGAGWRRAELSLSLDGGASWRAAGPSALPATIGAAVGTLGIGTATLFDRANSVDIDLLHGGMTLSGADDDALVGGANLAMLGEELIQFGAAAQIGARRWRLGRLLRGRRGSEWAIGGHGPGERFVLLDAATLRPLAVPLAAIGTAIAVTAIGPGDGGVAATAQATVTAQALRPPAPIALGAMRLSDGTIRFSWTRRSRQGWPWLDGNDAPIGEDGERYRLEIGPSTGAARTIELAMPSYDYEPAAQASDGTGAGGVTIRVTQLGTRAASLPPVIATFTL